MQGSELIQRDAGAALAGDTGAVDITGSAGAARALQAALRVLTPCEELFAREWCLRRNATGAYRASHEAEHMLPHVVRQRAYEVHNRPWVLARIREYESAAAAATQIDVQALLESDRAIVEGFSHAHEVTEHVWECCRYCHGIEHAYQWIDFAEYLAALTKAEADNDTRRARKLRDNPLPTDVGGYGFKPGHEPAIDCPQCEGRGIARTYLCDTTKLSGPAAAIVKGVRTTANGTEILLHDYDKAKERLLKAAGAFGDDAASVARAAAAGSAAGAAAAQALAKRVESMTPEEARRAYLGLTA